MKTTLRLVAAMVVVCGLAGTANAAQIDFYLNYFADGTWTLEASTNAPGGIAAIVVNLVNVETGESVAPRRVNLVESSVPFPDRGFLLGNRGSTPHPVSGDTWNNQAFAGQSTIIPDSFRKGIGYAPLPADLLGTSVADMFQIIGDVTVVPTVFYTGTWNTGGPPPDFGAPFLDGGVLNAGTVFATTDPSDSTLFSGISPPEDRVSYAFYRIPEPSAVILAGLAIPALVMVIRRRKVPYLGP